MGRSAPSRLPVALTMGEPAGIGPLVTLQAWKLRKIRKLPPFVYVGDPAALVRHAPRLPWRAVATPAEALRVFRDALPVIPIALEAPFRPGAPSPRTAAAVIEAVETAVELCQKAQARAVVTNPIHKETLQKGGFGYAGHTEYLGKLARCLPVMMLANEHVRAVPVTVHIPLKDVPKALTASRIVAVVEAANRDLRRRFGIRRPRLAATGLNPHAGEGGRLGQEEQKVIVPALKRLAAKGIRVAGPLPADSAFSPESRQRFDCIFAMTHDQALIPVKALDFRKSVNLTLGLPFVRTSPAHGTALDLVRLGRRGDPESLIQALAWAERLSRTRP
jgi:4-hydroxythreonine-4-phosphate dehydrogenase